MVKASQDEVILKGLCYHPDMQKELDKFKLDPKHVEEMRSGNIPGKFLVDDFVDLKLETLKCTCKGTQQPAAKKILPTADNTKKIVVYNSCWRTLAAAARRQLREQPAFCNTMMKGRRLKNNMMSYEEFCDYIFKKEIIPILEDFDYNLAEWMNHLTRQKQDEVLDYYLHYTQIDKTKLNGCTYKDLITYSMFCKREKQIIDDGLPKNRAIACPKAAKKYACGPVIWGLETEFASKFKGYCGGKNWEELEHLFEQYYKEGFVHTLQGDGSAFDSTQTMNHKYIDKLITNYLVDKGHIKHVEPELYQKAMNAAVKVIELKLVTGSGIKRMGDLAVNGTVFSGDPDTTFGNTLRMAMYIRYTMYLAGYKEEEFRLVCKGDDFVVFTQYLLKTVPWENYSVFGKTKYQIPTTDIHYAIKTAFYQVWHPSDTTYQKEEKGLGMVLKFLKVGDYSDIDFCSTHVIHYNKGSGNDKFKIVRQVNRMSPLNHWCTKALSYSNFQMKQYYNDLALSMRSWCDGMPLYSDYITALEEHAKQIKVTKPDKTPKVKPRLHFETKGGGKLRGFVDTSKYDKYGRDFVYQFEERQSKNRPSDNEVYDFLLERYNIGKLDISDFSKRLSTTLWVDPTL